MKRIKVLVVLSVCILMLSCSKSAQIKGEAQKQMEQTFKEVAKDPSSVKLSNSTVVFNDDSLCIIHVDFSAKTGLGTEAKSRYEYIFINSNDKKYEAFQEINSEEGGVYIESEKYDKQKVGTIYENLSYENGLHYLADIFVNTEGREAGVTDGQSFYIPVPTGTGLWELNSYTNDFGEKGSVKYLVINGVGVFSNSATTDSRMTALLFVDKSNYFSLRLVEYNSLKVKSDNYYDVRIKDKDGEIYTWVMANNEDTGQLTIRPFWTDQTDQEIIDTMQKILRKGGEVTFSLKERNSYSTPDTYLFKINTTGYNKAKTLL